MVLIASKDQERPARSARTWLASALLVALALPASAQAARQDAGDVRLGAGDSLVFVAGEIVGSQPGDPDEYLAFFEATFLGCVGLSDREVYWATPVTPLDDYRSELLDIPAYWHLDVRAGVDLPEHPLRLAVEYWNLATEPGYSVGADLHGSLLSGRLSGSLGVGSGLAPAGLAMRLRGELVSDIGLHLAARARFTAFPREEVPGQQADICAASLEVQCEAPALRLAGVGLHLGVGGLLTNLRGGFDDVGPHTSLQQMHAWDDWDAYRPIGLIWIRLANASRSPEHG